MKILLAVDGSTFSDAAADQVASRPWPENSEVIVTSVYEPPVVPAVESWVPPQQYFEEREKADQEEARNAVNRAVDRLRSAHTMLTIRSEIVRGHPADVILDRASQWNVDLIVMGSHGYTGLKRFLLGSVSQRVSLHAKCSVEIVRAHDTREEKAA